MSFARPEAFIVAGIVGVALALAYRFAERRKTAHDLSYSNVRFFVEAARPNAWIPRALFATWCVALALGACAVGGVRAAVPVAVRDGTVFICIDTSGSMQSTDVAPTRASAAKEAARAFIDEAPPGTRVGIITFSTGAELIAPLTADRAQLHAALDEIPAPNGATAIGDALQLAAQNLPPRGHRVVVLITDGVNNHGADPAEVAQYLGAHHVPIYTIGIGTPNGDVLPGTNEAASIDEDALRSYADASGGAYARAQDATQLRDALARLGRTTSLQRKNVDASLPAALGGGALLVVVFLAGLTLGRIP